MRSVLPQYERLTLLVCGVTPLLMHNWKDLLKSGKSDAQICKLSTREQAERSLYVLDDGQLFVPAAALKCAVIDAGRERRDGRRSLATTLMRSLRLPEDEECRPVKELPLFNSKTGAPLMKDDWVLHESRVWSHQKKREYMRGRAMVSDWAFVAQFEVLDEMWKGRYDLLMRMVRTAGLSEGLLDGRNKGRYSPPAPLRFSVDLLDRVRAGSTIQIGEFGRFVAETYEGEFPPPIARFAELREEALCGLKAKKSLDRLIAKGVVYA